MKRLCIFFQGIVGDPGLPGRDGDPGIEVLYALLLFHCTVMLLLLILLPSHIFFWC